MMETGKLDDMDRYDHPVQKKLRALDAELTSARLKHKEDARQIVDQMHELARCRADAERYRWLRERPYFIDWDGWPNCDLPDKVWDDTALRLDCLIDAALAGEKL